MRRGLAGAEIGRGARVGAWAVAWAGGRLGLELV